jgi:hypothetical protein
VFPWKEEQWTTNPPQQQRVQVWIAVAVLVIHEMIGNYTKKKKKKKGKAFKQSGEKKPVSP